MRTDGKKKNRLKVIAACSVAIFSLGAVLSGVYAWFTVAMTINTQTSQFFVINMGSCDFYSIELIKFDYKTTTYGTGEGAFTITDYLAPETGAVNKYVYDKDEGSFGYLEDSTWHPVTMMNMFDPVNLEIYNTDISSLNCNAIYKFTITSDDLTDVTMSATLSRLLDKVKNENDIFLSQCTDFDLYFPSVLSDSNPDLQDPDDPTNKPYYPSYFTQSKVLTELEEIYYKISYLSNNKTSHVHLYGQSEDAVTLLEDTDTAFVYDSTLNTGVISFYVNVNYSADELTDYKTHIYQGTILAVFDYGFRFMFVKRES